MGNTSSFTKQEKDAYATLISIVVIAGIYSFYMLSYYSMILFNKWKTLNNTDKGVYLTGTICSTIIFLFAIFGGIKSSKFVYSNILNSKM